MNLETAVTNALVVILTKYFLQCGVAVPVVTTPHDPGVSMLLRVCSEEEEGIKTQSDE